jgi:integrase
MVKSKSRRHKDKPDKPYESFPLFPHATKRWAKKIRGRTCYFGPWSDWQGALNKYQEQKDDLYAGRKPRGTVEGLTLRDLCNQFLTAKRHLFDTRELSARTFNEYHAVCERLIESLGGYRLVEDLGPDDFLRLRASLAKGVGPVTLANLIQRARVVFKWASSNCKSADRKPVTVWYGDAFRRPEKKVLRRARNQNGARMFEADEIRKLLKAATQPLKAMIFLGINCGFGNNDCGRLPISALDLDGGWVSFPRPKTEIPRRCPLWPETVKAIREALSTRPAPKDEDAAGLVFVTKYGVSWSKEPPIKTKKEDVSEGDETKRQRKPWTSVDNPIAKEMAKLLQELGAQRSGRGFYALRHSFETIGGESRDQVAVDAIMGHAPKSDDMSAVYRERISDDRLKTVTNHVHDWLFRAKQAHPVRG